MLYLITGAIAGLTLINLFVVVVSIFMYDQGYEVDWGDFFKFNVVFAVLGAGVNYLFQLYVVPL